MRKIGENLDILLGLCYYNLIRGDLMVRITGMSQTRIYRCWARAKHRCNYSTDKDYKHYGGRGIRVCDEWSDSNMGFTNFYNWAMSNGYRDDLTIDRIDVDGNYEPSNCRWATIEEQRNNMRSNVLITYKGTTMNLKQWSDMVGVNYRTMCIRYERGWEVSDILRTYVRCNVKYVEFMDNTKTVAEWAKYFNIKQDTLSARLKRSNYDMHIVYNKFSDMNCHEIK